MSKQVEKQQKGFTIIEVVLVLAIAGLIFLIVFLAVPALQSSRRDTQRKSDAGRFLAQLEQYAGNNNGEYPANNDTAIRAFAEEYMDNFEDPSGVPYDLQGDQTTAPDGPPGFYYGNTANCSGTATGDREVAVTVGIENGGFYCQDNQ